MAYTTPITAVTGEELDASEWNEGVRDNMAFLVNPPAARLRRSTNQSIGNGGSGAAISFDTKDHDTDGGMVDIGGNPTRLTIPEDGLYGYGATLDFAANASGGREIWVYLNGTTRVCDHLIPPAGGSLPTRMVIAHERKFVAGDYLELYAYQNSGGALNATGDPSAYPTLWASWRGEGTNG